MKMRTRLSTILCTAVAAMGLAQVAHGQVISQVYGGGGSSALGTAFKRDYVEIFNPTNAAITLAGKSIQVASATGTGAFQVFSFPAGSSIAANSYYTVQFDSNNNTAGLVGLDLPFVPDSTSNIALSGTGAKIALVNGTASIGTGSTITGNVVGTANLLDFIGYNTANAFEGAAAPAFGSNANALFRTSGGCVDTNSNATDFSAAAAAPRFSGSPTNTCTSSVPPSGVATPSLTNGCPGVSITVSVVVTEGSGPASAISTVVGDFSSLAAGQTAVAFTNTSGNTWTSAPVVVDTTATVGNKSIAISITDALARVGNSSTAFLVNNCALGLTTGSVVTPGSVCPGNTVSFAAVVRPGGITPPGPSTGITATLNLAAVGGSSLAMTANGTDANGNFLFNATYLVPTTQLVGGTVTVDIADAQGRTFQGTYNVNVVNCSNSASTVVISQVYGAGGNTGATFTNDYVELFNRTGAAIDISDWTLLYASDTGTFNQRVVVPAGTSIPAGSYYLIQLAAGNSCPGPSACGTALPTADFAPVSSFNMSATQGKVVLLSGTVPTGNQDLLCPATAPSGTTIQDYVGYGNGASCSEGSNAPAASVTNAIFRAFGGCQDFDQNGVDFAAAAAAPRNSSTTVNTCGVAPATGRCCAAAGGCTITTLAACAGGAPAWTTGITACGITDCPAPTGACTVGASCTIQTEAFCNGVSGTYGGNGSTCPAPSLVCCRGSTCSIVTNAGDCTTTGFAAGFLTLAGSTCNASGNNTSPCCHANYNKVDGVTVPDIFAFLGDWFANSPYAFVGGNGTGVGSPGVPAIFAFLGAWFAGCP